MVQSYKWVILAALRGNKREGHQKELILQEEMNICPSGAKLLVPDVILAASKLQGRFAEKESFSTP